MYWPQLPAWLCKQLTEVYVLYVQDLNILPSANIDSVCFHESHHWLNLHYAFKFVQKHFSFTACLSLCAHIWLLHTFHELSKCKQRQTAGSGHTVWQCWGGVKRESHLNRNNASAETKAETTAPHAIDSEEFCHTKHVSQLVYSLLVNTLIITTPI